MKFDENGNRIKKSDGNKSASQEFLEFVMQDVEMVASYMEKPMPEVKLKNGFGGDYTKSQNLLRVGFGDGVYTQYTREVVVHEMVHHAGHDHGVVMGRTFMSHHDRDELSPALAKTIFG